MFLGTSRWQADRRGEDPRQKAEKQLEGTQSLSTRRKTPTEELTEEEEEEPEHLGG